MLERIYLCIAMSKVRVEPCCNLTMGKVDENTWLCLRSLKKSLFTATILSSQWEKEEEYESWVDPVWEKERPFTDLEFSSWFSIAFLTHLSASFVFIGLRLVWDLFSELTPKTEPVNFRPSLSSWLVFKLRLYLFVSSCELTFKPESFLFFCLV